MPSFCELDRPEHAQLCDCHSLPNALTTSQRTGRSRSLCAIPDGPGYPRVNGISPDGQTFFFWDFSNEYTIDVATGKVGNERRGYGARCAAISLRMSPQPLQILSKAPIFSAPTCVGFPVWIPL